MSTTGKQRRKTISVGDAIARLETFAPLSLAESWDEVGLHVGDPQRSVSRGLLCIDLTEAVLAEAIGNQTDLIVAYHPPLFKPLTRLTTLDTKQRIVHEAVRNGIAIYSPHTALDAAPGGVNDWLAKACGEGEVTPISVTDDEAATPTSEFKLVVFIPSEHADSLRDRLSEAGAGWIGNYSHCSYTLAGEGTFFGHAGSNPVVGKAGKLERGAEKRIEMVCHRRVLPEVIAALREVHPYEEPAFDLYPLQLPPGPGVARLVTLRKAASPAAIADRIKKHLKLAHVKLARGSQKRVQRIALCAGAGYSVLRDVDADLLFTGEMRHHDVLDVVTAGKAVILAGHTNTERPYLATYRTHLQRLFKREVSWQISRSDREMLQIV